MKLCKRKSSQMYRLNEKVGDLIGKKRRNNPFQIVCLRIKRRKKITMFDKQLERGQPNLNQVSVLPLIPQYSQRDQSHCMDNSDPGGELGKV